MKKKKTPLPYPFSPRRRAYRARRLFYRPDRAHLSPREAMLERIAGAALSRLPELDAAQRQGADEAEVLRRQLAQAQNDLRDVRRRAEREKEESKRFAAQDFIQSLIPTLDSLDHALAAAEAHPEDAEGLAGGIRAICQQIEKALADHGIEKIQAMGAQFDPNVHEALGVEKTDAHPPNTVIQVLQGGYVLNGRLIRPARVRIAQSP